MVETLDQEKSTPPVPVITKASSTKTTKRMSPSGSNDLEVQGTRKALAVVSIGGDDDEEKNNENNVSGDVEDWDQTRVTRQGGIQGVTLGTGTGTRTPDNSHKCLRQNRTNLGHFGPKGRGPFGQNGRQENSPGHGGQIHVRTRPLG